MKKLFLIFSLLFNQVANAQSPMLPNTAPGILANLSASADPTANNDQTQGYSVGSIWQNSSTGRTFIARNVSTGAAVWITFTSTFQGPNYVASNWYIPPGVNFTGTNTPNATTLYTFPFIAGERITLGACGSRVTTAQASQNFQCAIYNNNVSTNRPTGNPLGKTADISTAATGAITSALSPTVQLEVGKMYWLAHMGNSTTAIFYSVCTQCSNVGNWLGSSTANGVVGNQVSLSSLNVTGQTYGTWPDLTSASFSEIQASAPGIIFQVSSVP